MKLSSRWIVLFWKVIEAKLDRMNYSKKTRQRFAILMDYSHMNLANEATDRLISITVEEIGRESTAGGMIQLLYDEVKKLKSKLETIRRKNERSRN